MVRLNFALDVHGTGSDEITCILFMKGGTGYVTANENSCSNRLF
jgi:hypothetical protein